MVLASGSPRRRLLLAAAGFEFRVEVPDIDETPFADESPSDLVARLSATKAAAVGDPDAVVLAADTVVVRDGEIIGKPNDAAEAVAILMSLSGRAHLVLTGWTVLGGGSKRSGVTESRVVLAHHTLEELTEYVERTEPFDKAGAYALQDDDGWLVSEVVGLRSNVMGLPLAAVVDALAEAGIHRSSPER